MEDSEIVKLLTERSEQAVAAVSQKYGRYCKKIALNILRNNEDADECVNEALMKLWNSSPPDTPDALPLLLARIVKNVAYDKLRLSQREKRGGGEVALALDEIADCVSGNTSVENEFEQKELQAAINSFLKKLSTRHRKMFLLRYWYCFSVSEIAGRLGTSENSVSVTLNRTRRKIKEYLTKRGYDI